MNSKKEKDEDWKKEHEKKAKKLGLSEEARLDDDQKDNIKSLGDNRFLVSTSSVEDEEIPDEMKSDDRKKEPEKKRERSDLKQEMSEQISKEREKGRGGVDSAEKIAEAVLSKLEERRMNTQETGRREEPTPEPRENRKDVVRGEKKENPIREPQKLVKLLSTYRISLDAPIRKLVKEIKRKGKEHLVKELEKIE